MAETEEFAVLLRRFRLASNLTLEHLAEKSQVSDRAISNMERGRSRGPQVRTVQALADGLGLDEQERAALLAAAAAGRPRPPTQAPGLCVLPAAIPDFTGRTEELTDLLDRVSQREQRAGQPRTVVVSGTAGLGKTTFAVQAAHQISDHFPDGTLFVDLRGLDSEPLSQDAALTRLLRALGIPDRQIPNETEEKAQLHQGILAGKRVLMVLDNAAYEAQIRQLLPTSGLSMALVTSRRMLTGIEHAQRFQLPSLSPMDATALLTSITLQDDTTAESSDLEQVAMLCGNMPLALRIAGNRISSRPGWTARSLADRLADEEHRLARLTAGDLRIENAFLLSYEQLSPAAAQTFRLLSLVPGPDLSAGLAAAVTDQDVHTVESILDELIELGLLHTTRGDRYGFHDLLRLYATAQLAAQSTAEERRRFTARMDCWLLETTIDAGRWFEPDFGTAPKQIDARAPLTTAAAAHRWIEAENVNWLHALRRAAAQGEHEIVLTVADSLPWFADHWIFWGHWLEVFQLGLEAARSLDNGPREVAHMTQLAWAQTISMGRPSQGLETARQAAELAGRIGEVGQHAWALLEQSSAAARLAQHEVAKATADASIPMFLAVHDAEGQSQARYLSSVSLIRLGRPEEALAPLHELARDLQDPAITLDAQVAQFTLTEVLQLISRIKPDAQGWLNVESVCRRALKEQRDTPASSFKAAIHERLGEALAHTGDTVGARHHFAISIQMNTETDNPAGVARTRGLVDELSTLLDPATHGS